MIEPRKLAAIDLALLGPALILAEFAAGVFLCMGLGIFIVWRAKSVYSTFLGFYIFLLGVNYLPLFFYAVRIRSRERARREMGAELDNRKSAEAKYRRQSLCLLIPLLPVIAAFRNEIRKGAPGR